jgi:hypothetical protein
VLRVEASTEVAVRARATALLAWSPVLVGAIYVVGLAVTFPRLIERVYWDSDIATGTLIGETADGGALILAHYGSFTSLWFLLATKSLPFHRQLWEIAPLMFALASASLLAWVSLRLAGRWAATMTATMAVAVSPFVNYGRVTTNLHPATWVATVVLAVFAFWLMRKPRPDHVVSAGVLISFVAGWSLASDPIFLGVAVIPLGLSGLMLLFVLQERFYGAVALASAVGAVPIAWLTNWIMTASNVAIDPVPRRFAEDTDLWPNFGRLLEGIVQLVNGDYFFDAPVGARSTLSALCAGLALVALAVPFALVRRELRSASPSRPLLVYATFWAACIVVSGVGFVLSSEGTHGGHYLIPVLYALAATVPVAYSASEGRRLLAGLGIAVVATASFINLADSKTQLFGGLPPLASVADQIVDIAEREDAHIGYGDYWDAASLTWSKDLAVRVYPVAHCVRDSDVLCPYWFNVASTWYQARPGTSFLLRNNSSTYAAGDPPKNFGPPSSTHVIDDTFTMFVYPYDIASRLDNSSVDW